MVDGRMSVLLANDAVELYAIPGTADAHGWADPGAAPPAWTGTGNLQRAPGYTDRRAADAGGHGPFGPAAQETGILYLPPDANPEAGMTALIRGWIWALSQVREIADPTGSGLLDCWEMDVSAVSTWPVA
jgi:hypothetical protein